MAGTTVRSPGEVPHGAREVEGPEGADAASAAWRGLKLSCAREAHDIDHDLRGPLGAIAVAVELLRVSNDAATHAEVGNVIARQVARIEALMQRVHALAERLDG